ncbi:MAG: hypothetical protein ACR2FS_02035, partial [Phormidesmis sp.]
MNTAAHSLPGLARTGDISAITSLINKAVQNKGITATVDLEDGDLQVMLDAKGQPPEQAADFIHRGIQKIGIESAYTAKIYGRI